MSMSVILVVLVLISGFVSRGSSQKCPTLEKIDNTTVRIYYRSYYKIDCKWELPAPPEDDHVAVLQLSGVRLTTNINSGYCTAYLIIPGIPKFCHADAFTCMIFSTSGDHNTTRLQEIVKALKPTCKEPVWVFRDQLPAEINVDVIYGTRKSFILNYTYVSYDEADNNEAKQASSDSGFFNNGGETDSNSPTIHVGSFVAVVVILIILLIACALAILWMHRRQKKLKLTSNALRSSIRAATRVQGGTIQRPEERSLQQQSGNAQEYIGYVAPQPYAEFASYSAIQGSPAEQNPPESQLQYHAYENRYPQSQWGDNGNMDISQPHGPDIAHSSGHERQRELGGYVNSQPQENVGADAYATVIRRQSHN